MRFFKTVLAVLSAASLISCQAEAPPPAETPPPIEPVSTYIQEKQQLHIDGDIPESDYQPLNYAHQVGLWFPYMHYGEYMYEKSESEFRSSVSAMYGDAKAEGVNTIYVHIHPCGDAYYKSEIFPSGDYLDGDYDPLQIMIEEAHKLELSVHAWINPLRLQTAEQMEKLPDSYITKKWTEEKNGTYVSLVNSRWYLNPAYDEVVQLICDCADEILQNYQADGFHIDDYFYPTKDESFDAAAFAESGSSELTQWRLDNCSRMVRSLFERIKRADQSILFGISPQGNISANYSSQYADVRLWSGSAGYCDYIVPQIYFGFKNETCPFEETLAQWESIVSCPQVSLVIGLAEYKQGEADKWAGAAGELEWIEEPDVIERQIALCEASSACGYALYR